MSNWIRTGNWSDYRKAGLLSPNEQGHFKTVLLFFEHIDNPSFQHSLGFFNYYTKEWQLAELEEGPSAKPSHFQLLTTPTH